ncbi:MAG: preprotein translocase subunit YajC [Ruminococcaceae bacterium]|nr:preprotein translocase subunit YajC [Oscillospiraceae bacterium]
MNAIWIIVLVALGAMFIFSMRSSKKREREEAEMRNSLSVGDEITTIGGIIGKIVSVKDETMVIETTRDHTRIRLLKSAVRSVDVPANAKRVSAADKPADAPAEKKEAATDKKVAPAEMKEENKPVKEKKNKKAAQNTEAAAEAEEKTDETNA